MEGIGWEWTGKERKGMVYKKIGTR